MGYPTKVQLIHRKKTADQYYINFPTAVAEAMDGVVLPGGPLGVTPMHMPFEATVSDPDGNPRDVIITGGAQNIGAGIARTLSGAGARVMIADLNGDKAEEVARSLAAATGRRTLAATADVADEGQVDLVATDVVVRGVGAVDERVDRLIEGM